MTQVMGLWALMAVAGAGQGAAERAVTPAANPQWVQVEARDGARTFLDRNSIRSANGNVHYTGRTLLDRPDEYGAIEIVHTGQINCAGRHFRVLAFDALGPHGSLIASHVTPADEPTVTINAGSLNDELHGEFCR